MVLIEKSILHILDINAGNAVYSDQELLPEDSTLEFLDKHIEKTINSPDAKSGSFYEDSEFQTLFDSYVKGETQFVDFSQSVAKKLAGILAKAEEVSVADIIICQILTDDEKRKLVILKCNSKQGYSHQIEVDKSGKVQTGILNSYAILPSFSQRVDEYAYIDFETKNIRVKSRRYHIDGNQILLLPELLLECQPTPSATETIKKISKVVEKVADSFGENKVATTAAVKSYMTEELKNIDSIDPQEAGKEIFKKNPDMQAKYQEVIEKEGYTTPVQVDQEATIKKLRKHKLSTDIGVELTIPTDYLENTQYVEFSKDFDGSMSITIKNIKKLKNK